MLYDMKLQATGQHLVILEDFDINPMVQGSENIYRCTYEVDDIWTGFTLYGVFRLNNGNNIGVELDANNQCLIPNEATADVGRCDIGLCGLTETQRLPSNWVRTKAVQEGAIPE